MNLKKALLALPIYIIFLATALIIRRDISESHRSLLDKYNNPPAINNLVFNSIQAWKYNLDTILNTRVLTYPDTIRNTTLFDLTRQASLVFRFSGNMCSPCVDFVIDRIKFCIQDFEENERVLFLYSDANPALAEDYFVKQAYYLTGSFHQELDDMMVPYLCVLDSDHRILSLYIPDMAYPDLLDRYLEIIRDKLEN
ncbi:MAG: hypothetical protein M9948_06700 [Lentimicrobium sp.]|nr:hypothetical protein [Lentimicrobium sp.]